MNLQIYSATCFAVSIMFGCTGNDNLNIEPLVPAIPETSSDQYVKLRKSLEEFSIGIEENYYTSHHLGNGLVYQFSGGVLLKAEQFGSDDLYGSMSLGLDTGSGRTEAKIGNWKIFDPSSLELVSSLHGELTGNGIAFDGHNIEGELSGDLRYDGLVFDMNLSIIGAVFIDNNTRLFLPLAIDGELISDSGSPSNLSGVGILNEI